MNATIDYVMAGNVFMIALCLLLTMAWLVIRICSAAITFCNSVKRLFAGSAASSPGSLPTIPGSPVLRVDRAIQQPKVHKQQPAEIAEAAYSAQRAEIEQRAAVDNLQRAESVQRADTEQPADSVQGSALPAPREQGSVTPALPSRKQGSATPFPGLPGIGSDLALQPADSVQPAAVDNLQRADSVQRAVVEQGSATPAPIGLPSKKQRAATPLPGLPGGPQLHVGGQIVLSPRQQGSVRRSAVRTEVSASRSASEQGPATPAPRTQGSAKRSAVRTEDAGQRGPAAARERARPFAELYARWHLSEIKNGGPIARDDIWVYAGRLAASSGASLPKRDNFFAALFRVPGVIRISDTRVPITTKSGCPIEKTTAYAIKEPSKPDVRAVGSASWTASPPDQAASASRL